MDLGALKDQLDNFSTFTHAFREIIENFPTAMRSIPGFSSGLSSAPFTGK